MILVFMVLVLPSAMLGKVLPEGGQDSTNSLLTLFGFQFLKISQTSISLVLIQTMLQCFSVFRILLFFLKTILFQ